eukprot:332753_1
MAWLYMFLWMLFTTSSACTFEHNSPTFLQDGTKIGNIILGEIIEITFELRMNDTCPIPSGWCKLIHVFNQSYDINGDPIYNDSELKIPYINIPESTNGIRMIFSEPNAPGGKVKQTFSSGSYPNLHTAMIDNNFHTYYFKFSATERIFVFDNSMILLNITDGTYDTHTYSRNTYGVFVGNETNLFGIMRNICINVSFYPTNNPTYSPSISPTASTLTPSKTPTINPSNHPTTNTPTFTRNPTIIPTTLPTIIPTIVPTKNPTNENEIIIKTTDNKILATNDKLNKDSNNTMIILLCVALGLLILICCQCACFVIYKKQKNKLKDILKPTTTNINPGTALQMQQIQSSSVMQQIQSSSVATTGSPNASGQIVLAGTDTSNAFKHDHENSDSDEIYNNSPPMDDITPMTPIAAVNAINIATNTKGFDSNNTYSGTNNITYSDNNDNNDETAEKQYEGKVVNLITGDKNIDDIDDDMYEPAKETDVGHDVGDDEDELYISNGDVEKTKDTTKGYIN